jgi:hypothetical protein
VKTTIFVASHMMKRNKTSSNPWGAILGLCAWCSATLTGVWSGLEPDDILVRAIVAGLVVGLIASILARLLGSLLVREGQRRK